jgi:regulator of protease activity HflC (stomatin/prohibitin superfamily)
MWQFLAVSIVGMLVIFVTVHQVDEGYRGVYWRGGALLSTVTRPGFHLKMPFVTTISQVQVTVQTDSVTNIPCGTSGGVLINFGKIEVVNRLKEELVYETIKNYTVNYDQTWIFDKIHHEINQFCSAQSLQEVYITLFDTLDDRLANALQNGCNVWAPGIEILAVRVTKPRIPEQIKRNYEAMEGEKTKLLIATEAQKVVEMEAETDKKKATIEAEKKRLVSEIEMKRMIMEKEAESKVSELEDKIQSAHSRARTDASFYAAVKEAEGNEKKLTSSFIEYQRIKAVANNSKIYFGERIPNMLLSRDVN